jgi:hypothetical protein
MAFRIFSAVAGASKFTKVPDFPIERIASDNAKNTEFANINGGSPTAFDL